nr:MAG TPA_asm: hypothetical protein [Caudoviricetes sp.]
MRSETNTKVSFLRQTSQSAGVITPPPAGLMINISSR